MFKVINGIGIYLVESNMGYPFQGNYSREDMIFFDASSYSKSYNNEYRSSPSEFYVRFHGLKKWMIDNGYLKDMNYQITQEKLIKVFNDKNASKAFFDFKIDFFEILFYMNVDMTGKTKSDVSKANSIVANYNDFKNNYNA